MVLIIDAYSILPRQKRSGKILPRITDEERRELSSVYQGMLIELRKRIPVYRNCVPPEINVMFTV